jgi:hypothetical protein
MAPQDHVLALPVTLLPHCYDPNNHRSILHFDNNGLSDVKLSLIVSYKVVYKQLDSEEDDKENHLPAKCLCV